MSRHLAWDVSEHSVGLFSSMTLDVVLMHWLAKNKNVLPNSGTLS
jgi:hypothetical protein